VIIATIVEFAQRMLTNLPTVPRTSESGIWRCGRSPTRAREPRTEITRPKELTVANPGMSKKWIRPHYAGVSLHKRLSRGSVGRLNLPYFDAFAVTSGAGIVKNACKIGGLIATAAAYR
jgi:hypothetical protein